MRFDEEVKEILKEAIEKGYEREIPLAILRGIAVTKKRSLAYPHYWKSYFQRFLDVCFLYKFGKYDETKQVFILNESNEEIIKIMLERIKIEDKKLY
jgi:hypothetical protein